MRLSYVPDEMELFMPVISEEIAVILGLARGEKGQLTSPLAIIRGIERGLTVTVLDRVSRRVAPSDVNFKYHIVPKATLARRKKGEQGRLSIDESDRLVRLVKVWMFAREAWGSDEEARAFLFRPHAMLEGRKPMDVMLRTDLGARLVEDILGRLKYGSAA
jgi:putative toxin-antitoxin system antitoxin component (TIGR02293 family)